MGMIESGSIARLFSQESMMDTRLVLEQARKLGFDLCLEFDTTLLVPEESIRAYCSLRCS